MNDGAQDAEFSSVECQSCGACCSFSAEWPRFSLESDADLARIPRALVDDARGRMRCDGNRCSALFGTVGVATSCAIYDRRPDVCKACVPGDDACRTARRHFGLHACKEPLAGDFDIKESIESLEAVLHFAVVGPSSGV